METIKGAKFNLNDYTDELGQFDLFEQVRNMLTIGGKEFDDEKLFHLPIVFTNGGAYCDVPNIGRAFFPCETDAEWMVTREPKEFDLYDDLDEGLPINRWQIWYTTQKPLSFADFLYY